VRIVGAQKFESAIGEHHAEAERGAGGILLDDLDLRVGPPALQQICEIEAGWTRADDDDAHGPFLPVVTGLVPAMTATIKSSGCTRRLPGAGAARRRPP